MDVDAELHDLGAIRVEPPRRPLGLDKMFARAGGWRSSRADVPLREVSPMPPDAPLALPLASSGETSPLSRLFEYPELVPCVLEQLTRPSHIAAAMSVCRTWEHHLKKWLYRDVWVRPWEAAPKAKLIGLFQTLAARPDLCALVRSLDIRFFPLDLQGDTLANLEENVLVALANMTNLTRLVWTRDRSISAELFNLITSLPSLRALEISGHSTHAYDPTALGAMPHLEDLRVMMPDATFKSALGDVLAALSSRPTGGLRSLALVCKSTNLINDTTLRAVAHDLTHLRHLTLIGVPRISKEGVYPLLQSARIEELVLDASPYSDLVDLSDAPDAPLRTFSLSFPAPRHTVLLADDMPRLHAPDLTALELTLSNPTAGGHRQQAPHVLSSSALSALLTQVDFGKLTRLALLNLHIDSSVLQEILVASPALQELYISITSHEALSAPALRGSPLRILHANAAAPPSREYLTQIAASMPRCEQIGTMNRVYEVRRRYEGESVVVDLVRWARVYTPGYFLVWRP